MKEKVLLALRKIGSGSLYGIGFGLTMSAISFVMMQQPDSSFHDDRIADSVIITKHEETKLPDAAYVLGTIENRGTKPTRAVRITVDLFDKQGKFVDQYFEYLPGTLNPGESRNFKLTCSSSRGRMPAEHAIDKLVVTGI